MVVQMGRVPSTNSGGWAECLGEEWWRRGEQWNDPVSKSNNWESLAWQTLYIELWIIDAFALPPVVVWQCTNMFDCMTIDHKIVALLSLYKLHKDTLLSMFRRPKTPMFHLKIFPRWRFDLWWCTDYPAYYWYLNAVPGGTLRNAVAKRHLAAQPQRWRSTGWFGQRFVIQQLKCMCLHDHGSYLCLSVFTTEVYRVGAVILIHLDIPLDFTFVNQTHLGNTQHQRFFTLGSEGPFCNCYVTTPI